MAASPPVQHGIIDDNGVLWKASSVGKFETAIDSSVETLWDLARWRFAKDPSREAIGARPVLERSFEADPATGRQLEKLVLGDYEWATYSAFQAEVEALAAGLGAEYGLKPKARVMIFADTAKEWLAAALAAWRQNMTICTCYSTLGEASVGYALRQTRVSVVLTQGNCLQLVSRVASSCPALKHVVVLNGAVTDEDTAAIAKAKLSLRTMAHVVSRGQSAPVPEVPSKPTDTAVVMYTSGTTSEPKGVVLSHGALLATVGGSVQPTSVLEEAPDIYEMTEADVFLCYLPLAHSFELVVELVCFAKGARLGYGHPQTLLATSPRMKQTTPPQTGDAAALKPTCMILAPAVLDRIYAGISARVRAGSAVKRGLFELGLREGKARMARGLIGAGPVTNAVVFRTAQKLLGGNVRFLCAGSAPVSPPVQEFVQIVFNAPVRQGYGLTETCAGTCLTRPADNSLGTVGVPQPSACIRLRDWEEGNYKWADKDDPLVGMPRGEVLIGGPTLCDGYFNPGPFKDRTLSKLNRESFVTLDGVRYFCTGDIGQIRADGNLEIVDRKKDLVKLSMGEYLALAKIEAAVKTSRFVAFPMVYAEPTRSFCLAVVVPAVPALRELAASFNIPDTAPLETLCHDALVRGAVLKDLKAASKAFGLKDAETPKSVVLVWDEWTPENGMLTPTQKLKRRVIVDSLKERLDAAYSAGPMP